MTALVTEPWLITPAMHKTLCDIVTAHATNPQSQHALASAMPQNPTPRQFEMRGDNVAVIPVDGVIGRKFSSALYSSGVTSVDVLARLVDTAAQDEEVNAILMVYDSPGGTVQGVMECANAILRARQSKPVWGYVDGQANSAACWLLTQCTAAYAWQEATVGSIGVYSAFLDRSREMEMAGIKPVIFRSGIHKAMGFPGTSLTEKERDMAQARVDEIGATFRGMVRSGRAREIADEVMQGQAFTAQEALKNGLIDSITDFAKALSDAGAIGRNEKQQKGKQK
jgi:signal peptide peptidase SppA